MSEDSHYDTRACHLLQGPTLVWLTYHVRTRSSFWYHTRSVGDERGLWGMWERGRYQYQHKMDECTRGAFRMWQM